MRRLLEPGSTYLRVKARSRGPPALKWPTAMEVINAGSTLPGRGIRVDRNVPSPRPRSTPNGVTRSETPSPLKSPAAIEVGCGPGKETCSGDTGKVLRAGWYGAEDGVSAAVSVKDPGAPRFSTSR